MMYLRRVVGDSMLPTLKPGQLIFAINKSPKIGDIVIAQVGDREIVKRVVSIIDDTIWLEGDNKQSSTDSRVYGAIPIASIKAVRIL